MPPKRAKVQEDARSPLEIAIANTQEQIAHWEAQVTLYREGVADLATHTQRVKTLEGDIVPRETELKVVNNAYTKLLENGVTIVKRSHTDVATAAGTESGRPPSGGPSRGPSRAASRAGAATPLAGPQPPTTDEVADREALRAFASVVRENLSAVVTPLFHHERTQVEALIAEKKAREAQEAAAAAQAAQEAASAPPQPPTPAKGKPQPPAASAAAKAPANPAQTQAQAQLEAKLLEQNDMELYRPPGLDPHFYADVLKLRAQRLQAERTLKTLQQQLTQSRQLVARRTNEGASKAALKRAEKTLSMLNTTLRDLLGQRDETDTTRRKDLPGKAGKGRK